MLEKNILREKCFKCCFLKRQRVFFFRFPFRAKVLWICYNFVFLFKHPSKTFLAQIQKLLSVHTFIEYNIYICTYLHSKINYYLYIALHVMMFYMCESFFLLPCSICLVAKKDYISTYINK